MVFRSVTILASNIDGASEILSVSRRTKGSSSKIQIPCPAVVREYNAGMGGVDLADQLKSSYELDRKSKFRFYLRIFFDLLDIACVNAHIVFTKVSASSLSLKDFKLAVSESMLRKYTSRQRAPSSSRPTKRHCVFPISEEIFHLPVFNEKRRRCIHCMKRGQDLKTFVTCDTCNVPLCLQKERNCFRHHHQF